MIETVPVEVMNGNGSSECCDLIVLDVEKEKFGLTSAKPPKVLSVDSLLKAALAILLLICTTGLTYIFTRVNDHQDRITKNETWIEFGKQQSEQVLSRLNDIQKQLGSLKTHDATVSAHLESIKELLKKK